MPEGSAVQGHVVAIKRPGRLKQLGMSTPSPGEMELALDQIMTPDGIKYTITAGLSATEDMKHAVLIPAGYGLRFIVDQCKLSPKPIEASAPLAEQETQQRTPSDEVSRSQTTSQSKSPPPASRGSSEQIESLVQPRVPLTPAQAR